MNVSKYVLRGRGPVICAAFILLSALAIGYMTTGSIAGAWQLLGVHSFSPTFADLRFVTHALDSIRQGHDPYVENVCDPWQRLFNYPPIWLHLASVSVGPEMTDVIGVAFAVIMLVACLLLFKPRSNISAGLVILSVLSPPVLLAIERGNIDVLIFSLLILGLYVTATLGPITRTSVRAFLIIFLSILKVYPAAVSVIFMRVGLRSYILAATVSLLSIALLLYFSGDKIYMLGKNTPQEIAASFGAPTIFYSLAKYFGILEQNSPLIRLSATAFALACTFVIVFAVASSPVRWPDKLALLADDDTLSSDFAVSSISIFIFSFLLGSNFDYRLIFLLGAMPRLLQQIDHHGGGLPVLAPTLIILFLWMSRIAGPYAFLDEPLDWIVFFGCVAWLTRSVLHRRVVLSVTAIGPGGDFGTDKM
jgi:hypothetical protein